MSHWCTDEEYLSRVKLKCKCGGTGELTQVWRLIPKRWFEVVCPSCKESSGYWETTKLAIERWNLITQKSVANGKKQG